MPRLPTRLRLSILLIQANHSRRVDKATADIHLKPENRITLSQLRQTIRKSGYPTKDAQVEARGAVVDRNGKPAFDLQNGSFLELAAKPPAAGPGVVTIIGVSRVVDKEHEIVTIIDPK